MRDPLHQRYTTTAGVRLDTGQEQVDDQEYIVDFAGRGPRVAVLFVRGDGPNVAESEILLMQDDVRAVRDGMSRWLAEQDHPAAVDRAVDAVIKAVSP